MTKEKHPLPITYKNSNIYFDGKSLSKIAKARMTPFYLYSEKTLHHNFNSFNDAAIRNNIIDPLICFALKANPNPSILKSLASIGAGADIVSGGELKRALQAGISPSKIVFSGVGKTQEEIEFALKVSQQGIYSFNVESLEELVMIVRCARKQGKVARVSFRFNPQVHAKTHKHISTGFKTHKFGLVEKDIIKIFKKYKSNSSLKIVGLSMHIGSQLTCLKATNLAIKKLSQLALEVNSPLEFLDVGGGLGVHYKRTNEIPVITSDFYMKSISQLLNRHYYKKCEYRPRIVFEPGRCIVAEAGVLITKVIRTKTSEECHFTIVDSGMNDFIRTSLYDAYHQVLPLKLRPGKKIRTDIVGPICETADRFATQIKTNIPKVDDYFCVCDTGAYGFSMASNYNLRKVPSEFIMTTNGKVHS